MIAPPVAPFTGAWIEMPTGCRPYGLLASLPSRERGLKWRRHVHDHRSLHVAPFTGAWIEIAYWQVAGMPKEVAPFTGAWIEIVNGRTISPFWLVAPFTGAWIEIPQNLHCCG